ncbi:hypothetical protein [Paenibacillus sp. SI8]|uniref:hypothetical protein n=1 Tax=unclassified Paenibacillus TaxID=185978 RepID=UPI00346534A1
MRKQLMVIMGAAILATSTSGIVLPAHPAFANESVATTDQAVQLTSGNSTVSAGTVDFSSMFLNKWLSKLDVNTAIASGIKTDDFTQLLHTGSTLQAASGLIDSDLISKLTDLFAQNVASEVQAGSLTDKEAGVLQQQFTANISGWIQHTWNGASPVVFLQADGKNIVQNRLNRIISDAALAAVLSETDIRQSLHSGKSLVEATGLDASTLSDDLTALLNEDLDAGISAGSIQADQRDQLAKSGADNIWAIINEKGYDHTTNPWMEKYGQALLEGKLDESSIIQSTATYSDKKYEDILAALALGQSLVEASGLASADLLSQLLDPVKQDLDREWNAGNISAKLRDQLQQRASDEMNKAINQPGYGKLTDGSSNHQIAEESIQSIVESSANYAGLSVVDLRKALTGGQSLVEATLEDEADLSSHLVSGAHSFIDQAVQKGWMKASDTTATQTEADALVNDAINRRGYKDQVDTKQYLADRSDRIIDDIASISGIETSDLLRSLAEGKSLSQAANTDADSLFYNLLERANQEINRFVAAGALSENDASALKTDYTSMVEKTLNSN